MTWICAELNQTQYFLVPGAGKSNSAAQGKAGKGPLGEDVLGVIQPCSRQEPGKLLPGGSSCHTCADAQAELLLASKTQGSDLLSSVGSLLPQGPK